MTTNTPTSSEEVPVIHGLESPAGLPDEAELTRWANAIFKALPGLDGLGRGASLQGVDGGTSAARQASDT
jgi:hypothetical protein